MNKVGYIISTSIIFVIDLIFALFWFFNPEIRVDWLLLEFPIFLTIGFLFFALISLIPKVNTALNKPGSSSSGCIIALVIAAAVFIGCLVLWNQYLQIKFAPFDEFINEYISISDHKELSGGEYITGKIFPIDLVKNKVDELVYFNLPNELRPSQPQEVGTIVLLEWGKEQVGEYTDGGKAYIQTCKVTIINKSLRAIIGEKSFFGSNPPGGKHSGSGDTSGNKPIKDVLDYLKGLPHK